MTIPAGSKLMDRIYRNGEAGALVSDTDFHALIVHASRLEEIVPDILASEAISDETKAMLRQIMDDAK